jgi:hypothetical protein
MYTYAGGKSFCDFEGLGRKIIVSVRLSMIEKEFCTASLARD